MAGVTLDNSWLWHKTSPKTIQTGYESQAVIAKKTGKISLTYTDKVSSKVIQVGGQYQLQLKTTGVITQGSLRFDWGNKSYFDKDGLLYCDLDHKTGNATPAGVINYQTGLVIISQLPAYTTGKVQVLSLRSAHKDTGIAHAYFVSAQNLIMPASLTVQAVTLDGQTITGRADVSGNIVGDITGFVDVHSGLVSVKFGRWVDYDIKYIHQKWYHADLVKDNKIYLPTPIIAKSLRYSAVAHQYIPIANHVLKIDTVRLPTDGRVPIFRAGDMILISNTIEQELGSSFKGSQVINLIRQDLDRLCLQDNNGKAVLATLWDYDLKAGTITFAQDVNLSGYAMPLIAKLTHEERNRVISTDIDGTLGLQFATKRDYPIKDTYVSSVLIGDNLKVRATVPFTQRAWTNVWQDKPIGESLLNRLNVKDYPIRLTDDGTISERWLIKFVSSNQFELYGEAVGFVLKTDTLSDLAPINPATNKPYFTIPRQAFGSDTPWASQDVIRFDTFGTLMPFWVIQAVQPTATAIDEKDGFSLCVFGDTTVY